MRSDTEARRLLADGSEELVAAAELQKGDAVVCEAGDLDPVRRRHHRGRRVGRRVGHHRRVRTGHPGVRRRPFRGHRRHQGAVGPHRGADHRRARPHLPRPDDQPGRGRQPAEDAERDRAHDPAGGAHDRLPAGRGRAPAVRATTPAATRLGRGARRAARLPHPDDDRRAAVGDRHRRHGPARAAQRAGDVRPGGRGGRRRADVAARQDRHDHPRQPDGVGLPPGRRPQRAASSRTPPSSPRSPTRRPRAARSSCWPRSASRSASASSAADHAFVPVLRARRGCPASTSTAGRSARAPPSRSSAG